MAKQISIQDLKPGMFILGIIEQNGPVKIKKTGLVTSAEMVQGLAEMGVLSLAIDLEKTVEIEVEDSHHVSQTQFVMQANEETPRHDADNQLSEQFNRSLFMPSLQQVPSAWQYYGAQVAIAALVVVIGFVLGWFGSNIPALLSDKQVLVVNTTQQDSTNEAKVSVVSAPDESTEQETQLQDAVLDESETSDTESTTVTAELPMVAQNQPVAPQNQAPQVDNNTIESGVAEIQTAQNTQESVVSPELLKRFEDAMAELERESSPTVADDGQTLEYGDVSNDYNNTQVQRVDQLPARVMTRLPGMSFSAHMYASNPRDRWVKLNGIEMGEGEWLDDKLFIERIEPQHVILVFEGHQFSMRALSEW
ncbi:general secretion pathway protein GspB [Planctobacterium marinum]|uniref:General secretion pathway protein B n=1 Tax=Planctobacterium marinum TaxID=1631968 RepID=A0AA48HKL3_9ALTE|nr:hypothetical protein MACH26_24750 [Planctobacterium marinum]